MSAGYPVFSTASSRMRSFTAPAVSRRFATPPASSDNRGRNRRHTGVAGVSTHCRQQLRSVSQPQRAAVLARCELSSPAQPEEQPALLVPTQRQPWFQEQASQPHATLRQLHSHPRLRPLIANAQCSLHHFEFGGGISGNTAQPGFPCRLIGDAIRISQRIRTRTHAIFRLHPTQQRHADLRAETRAQPQRILDRIRASLRQVERSQLRIDFLEVSHRRDATGFQRFHRQHFLDAGRHGVAGEALGVGNHDLIGDVAENMTQRMNLGRGAAAPGRSVGFMRDEDSVLGDLAPRDTAAGLGSSHLVLP